MSAKPGSVSKKTMTLNLNDAEMEALEQLSLSRDMTKTAILRQALRLYQVIDDRRRAGEKLFFGDDLDKEKKELVVL